MSFGKQQLTKIKSLLAYIREFYTDPCKYIILATVKDNKIYMEFIGSARRYVSTVMGDIVGKAKDLGLEAYWRVIRIGKESTIVELEVRE